jgi:hypothetical protein
MTDSHAPPGGLVTDAAAVNVSAAPVLVTAMLCDAGTADPIWCVKLSDVGLAASAGCGSTFSVTGTVSGLFEAPAAVIVTEPV